MDSLPQSDRARESRQPLTAPSIAAASEPVALPDIAPAPAPHWFDWAIRFALWAVAVAAFAAKLGGNLANSEVLLPLLIVAALMAFYLLASVAPVARRLYAWAQAEPVAMSVMPLLLLAPYVLYGRLYGTFEASDLLTAGVLLFMPVALAVINTGRLRVADASLGLIVVAMPLVLPLTNYQTGAVVTSTDVLLRLGAFALPALLLALASRKQRAGLNFLFVCAVLSLWYSIEFNAFPGFDLPGQPAGLSYFHLAAICAFLYIVAVSGRFSGLGLSFSPTPHGLSVVASNLALFALIAIPVGLVTRFVIPGIAMTSAPDALARAFTIYIAVALPEEILFRGTLLRYLDDTFRWPQATTIVVSALIFGAAHLDNPPNAGWYFVLATIAGVFYARTYLATKNVTAAATLHTAVNWIWALVFAG
ncbi:MAG: CPBP family intramembrane metalloprotease [Chloroflexi bacterium]|nr:CPBP family intramembrane metalloprotease [Chloroflexota bacterium]MCL5275865.1 CPBP family intramembrane metalloprotease [Chloroflexota bacterium]